MGCQLSLYKVCKKGDINEVHNIINKGDFKVSDWNSGLIGACEGVNIDIIRLMIAKGADNIKNILKNLRSGDNIDIVKLKIEYGVYKWKSGLYNACENGYIDIIKLIIDKGSHMFQKKHWNNGLFYACYGGCKGPAHTTNIVNLLIEKGADDWNSGLIGACEGPGGDINIVKLMIDKGATNISDKYVYPRDRNDIIMLLKLGISIDKLKDISGICEMIYNINSKR